MRSSNLVAAAGLTAVWVLLWGGPTVLNVAGGLIVAAVVLKVFPLPPVDWGGRIRLRGTLRFAGRFLLDLVMASVQITVLAFRFGHQPRNAVIAVPLRSTSDLTMTLTAEALSLVPGSLIVEADREAQMLYVHVLDVGDRAGADRARQDVLDLEGRILDAIGKEPPR